MHRLFVYDGTMRSLIGYLFLTPVLSMSLLGAAHADIGPAPKCPDGKYSAYLKGRRCVKNGYRLQEDAEGRVQEVRIAVPAEPKSLSPPPAQAAPAVTETPSAPAAPTPPAEKPVAPAQEAAPPAPASAQTTKSGGCAMAARSGSASLVGSFSALALLLASRRRRRLRNPEL